MAKSPLYTLDGSPLKDADGNQIYVETTGPDPLRSAIVDFENRVAVVSPEDILIASPLRVFYHVAGSVKDYSVNWSKLLSPRNEYITGSTWTVPAHLSNSSASFGSATTTIFLSDDSTTGAYDLVNTITTSGGRTEKRTIRVIVQ